MGKFKQWWGARSRFTAMLAVGALVAAITIPSIVGAIAANLEPTDQSMNLVSPCAVFDTRFWDRNGDGTTDEGPAAGEEIELYVAGSTNSEAHWSHGFGQQETTPTAHQGGAFGGCGVPENAQAVYLSVTAVNTATGGNLRAWDNLGDTPSGGFLLYTAGENGAAGTFVAVNKSDLAETPQDGGDNFGGHILVKPSGVTHLKGVVFGYTNAD